MAEVQVPARRPVNTPEPEVQVVEVINDEAVQQAYDQGYYAGYAMGYHEGKEGILPAPVDPRQVEESTDTPEGEVVAQGADTEVSGG